MADERVHGSTGGVDHKIGTLSEPGFRLSYIVLVFLISTYSS
jgi:hypothetical protein